MTVPAVPAVQPPPRASWRHLLVPLTPGDACRGASGAAVADTGDTSDTCATVATSRTPPMVHKPAWRQPLARRCVWRELALQALPGARSGAGDKTPGREQATLATLERLDDVASSLGAYGVVWGIASKLVPLGDVTRPQAF